MMNENHERWTDRLSDYLDGEMDATERAALEAHLDACADCRSILEDLRRIVADAERLGAEPPERDLWPGIADAIGAPAGGRGEGVIPLPTAARPRRIGIFLTVPQLAAASVALALLSATATWWAGPGIGSGPGRMTVPSEEVTFTSGTQADVPPELSTELLLLEEAFASARDSLDPGTVRILEKNLGVIERAIDESRQALAVDPGNAFLLEHLQRAYRDKAEYLRRATSLMEWAS